LQDHKILTLIRLLKTLVYLLTLPWSNKMEMGCLHRFRFHLLKVLNRNIYQTKSKLMYLFFDTETTGLPRNWKAPVTDLNNWPRMIQIAWIFCDEKGNRIESDDFIIKPENYTIPSEASKIHGISTKKAMSEGAELENVLVKFNSLVEQADFIVAHNISFDEKIIGAELLRKNIRSNFERKGKLCTMKASTDYCKLPGPYGYKWPKLSELHIKLFGVDFDEAHDASVDINASEKCFWEMRRLKLI